ncbi:DUF6134 family protein [Dyadobacter psychrotolerans]|uniref:DUF3108 domain-containing protein n=1 Tax=Dyadobacter psychrotolerans TaxID=2541721 RepID=A0A4R5DZI5_9BACT|nr:DUF6134 family protein [Dyadobacter psychrotolerans]TDE18114.1 hypothetical protein E0F88_00755 [Dyadobacter psychrotolerans]
MKVTFIFLLLCITLSAAKSQVRPDTLHYDVVLSGANVGKMLAIREDAQDGKTQYTLISDINVNLLFFKVKVYYIVKSIYENDVLQSATVDTKTNKGVFQTRITKEKDLYVIKAHQYRHDLETTLTAPIDYSVAKAFFNEPTLQNQVFGEYLGDYLHIKPRSNRAYAFERQKQHDKYTYKEGHVNKVEKKFKFMNYVIESTD